MTCYKYVVTAQKPTATHFAVKGSFTAVDETNLVLGKGTRIEIYTITPDGLKPTLEFSIHGTITALKLYKPRNRDKSSLFIITSRHKYCVLSYHASQIITETSGDIGYPGQPRNETYIIAEMDPTSEYFAITLFESTITIIIPEFNKTPPPPVRKISLRKDNRRRPHIDHNYLPHDYINISLADKYIISLVFLQDSHEPTLLVLYDDPLGRRYLQIFTLDVKNRQLIAGDILMDHFEQDANLLIAMPAILGGVVLVAGKFIRYLKPNQAPIAIGIKTSSINSYSIMNTMGTRILLGDVEGSLHLLTLGMMDGRVDSLCFIGLGGISIPSCLAYLENDVVFVGSSLGDSQLIHVENTSSLHGEILKVIDEFPNLGPITDFCVADLDKQGQTQLITCSGVGKDSSLRIIRNGVGMNQLAAIEISGVKGVWALRSSFKECYDHLLVISFVNKTCLLQIKENAMSQIDSYSSIDLNCRTIITANLIHDMLLQVTDKSVRLMGTSKEGVLLDEWFPGKGEHITVAAVNPTQCVVSTGYGRIIAMQITDSRLVVIGHTQLEQEVSCIDISPIDPATPHSSLFVAVGLWRNVGVCLLSLPLLHKIAEEKLAGTVMPRSILMAMFENICYLLVALGDGQFYNFKLDYTMGRLWDKKRTFLGKLPIHLSKFISNGTSHVFAASDKPSVIHSRNQKLMYSNVNLKEVRCVTPFNNVFFPDAIALTTRDELIIGQMEEIQKLHITKIPTSDTPRRITYQETSRTFGIITERITSEALSISTTTGGFEIRDDQSFEVMDRIYFKQYERALSAASVIFEDDMNEYFVIGTGKESDAFETNSVGRIIVMMVGDHKLQVVHQLKTKGMVEYLKPFKGKLLASVQGMLYLYEWECDHKQLVAVCSLQLPSLTECITTYDNYIISGDMAYSVVVLYYDESTHLIVEVAAHERLKEVLAVEAIDDHLFIATEREGHLFVVERSTEDNGHDEPLLETVSSWHLGDVIRRFRYGSLGMNTTDPDVSPVPASLLFGTVSGSIGVIADLTAERFKLLDQMQYNMNKVVKSIGDLSHLDWRSVSIMDRKEEAANFIDGDLIESYLDLTPQQMQEVIDGQHGGRKLDLSVEDLCKVVEELMSIHS